jgi:hypothetical protein
MLHITVVDPSVLIAIRKNIVIWRSIAHAGAVQHPVTVAIVKTSYNDVAHVRNTVAVAIPEAPVVQAIAVAIAPTGLLDVPYVVAIAV